jgi:hypothetical protein
MQSMMQNFYKKKKKQTKKGYNPRAKASSKKKKTLTMNEMYKTIDQDSSSKSSGTNPDYIGTSSFYSQNMDKIYGKRKKSSDEKRVTFNVPRHSNFNKKKRVFTDNDVVDDILGNRKRGDTLKSEILMMRSDLQDYKQDVVDYNDLNRFEEFLKETDPAKDIEEEDEEDEYMYEEEYNTEPGRIDYDSMDMTREIQFMTKEERTDYFNYKKQKKKEKWEEEQKRIASFKPKINKKSKKIDTNRMKGRKIDRNQMLFGLKKVLDYRGQQLKEIVEAEKFMKFGRKEMMNCTFRPKVNKKKNRMIHRSSIQERAEAHNQRKRQRELQRQREREMEEVQGCTFRPKINRRKRKKNGD